MLIIFVFLDNIFGKGTFSLIIWIPTKKKHAMAVNAYTIEISENQSSFKKVLSMKLKNGSDMSNMKTKGTAIPYPIMVVMETNCGWGPVLMRVRLSFF